MNIVALYNRRQFHYMSWDWLGFKGRTSFEEGTELQLSILSRTLLRKSQVILRFKGQED